MTVFLTLLPLLHYKTTDGPPHTVVTEREQRVEGVTGRSRSLTKEEGWREGGEREAGRSKEFNSMKAGGTES